MRNYFLKALLATCILTACTKKHQPGPPTIDGYLPVLSVSAPHTVTAGQTIPLRITYQLANSCYRFSMVYVQQEANNNFDIHAIGTYPNPEYGNVACAEVVTVADTLTQLPAPVAGTYILHIYSNENRFRTDTVQVN